MKAMGMIHTWGAEYQGMWQMMVNTTDVSRLNACVLVNLKNSNGVLLQGPSGTGKTQSLKELARCMAKYCVIFNCSNQVNIQTLEKLLSGLCYTASWICLDQINRLTAQIMSVIANQINSIKNALVGDKQTFNFMGKKMQIKKGIGIFSTMNPIYLQRAKLTQNLKTYFRVISVNVPDYQKIIQVMLYSLNFPKASLFSVHIKKIFLNLTYQLSNSTQYDFGMRSMKTFILNLSSKSYKNPQQQIIQALYQTFYSRLDQSDVETFQKVLEDVLGIKGEIRYINKVQSINSTTQTGTIVVGDIAGKTTLIQNYIQLISKHNLSQHVHVQVFNINSLQNRFFIGQYVLGRWVSGVIQTMAKASIQNTDQMFVLVLDNRIKSQIIQNFNTLLDESKLLSLSNGTRIKVQSNFKLLMQTPDLSMSSPATITRCNIIYMSKQDISKTQLIQSILPKFDPPTMQRFQKILFLLNNQQILKIGKIYPLIWEGKVLQQNNVIGRKIVDRRNLVYLSENQVKGVEKILFYIIQLLELTHKVKHILTKQNTIPLKRKAQDYYLSFQKYQQGQFNQYIVSQKFIPTQLSYFIPTSASQHCKLITTYAIKKNLSIAWSGQQLIGKSTSINRSIKQCMQNLLPRQKKLILLPINKFFQSKNMLQILQDRISVKNNQVNQEIIVYVDNLNLAIEQTSQFVRFMQEYSRIHSHKTRNVLHMEKVSLIAELNLNNQDKSNNRMLRHFAQLPYPQINQDKVSLIYSEFIRAVISQSRTTSIFKESVQIQMDKLTVFLIDYMRKKNKINSQANKNSSDYYDFNGKDHFSYFELLRSLQCLKSLNQKCCKEYPDMLQFLLCQIRRQQTQVRYLPYESCQKLLSTLRLSFNQNYKQKYQHQYSNSLKCLKLNPSQVSFYSCFQGGQLNKITNWQGFKNKISKELMEQGLYLSDRIAVEILLVVNQIQYRERDYIVVGNQAIGKKYFAKMATIITNTKYVDVTHVDQDKISEFYFSVLKDTFARDQKVVIALDANANNFKKFMLFIERFKSGYPFKFLFKSQQTDQAFTLMQSFDDITYDKKMKSYDTVIEDFFKYSNSKVHLYISCRKQHIKNITSNYPNICQKTSIRVINDFPSQSIVEISQRILAQKMNQKQNSSRLASTFQKLYNYLQQIISNNIQNKGYSYFKYNAICHFQILQKYWQVQKQILQNIKENEQKINKCILKVQQTQQQVVSKSKQISKLQPQIKQKQAKLLQIVVILQEKRTSYEKQRQQQKHVKKQVLQKSQQIQFLQSEIQRNLSLSQPYLKQSSDCLLSIKRAQISDYKNNQAPHLLIKFTLECLCVIFGENQDWDNVKFVVADANLIAKMKGYQPKQQDCFKLKTKVQTMATQWTFQTVSKVSFGLRYLYKWIVAMMKCYLLKFTAENLTKQMNTKKIELSDMEQNASKKYSQLITIQSELNGIQEKYSFLKIQLKKLQQKISTNNRLLTSMSSIKQSLSNYLSQWKNKIKQGSQLKQCIQSTSAITTYYLKIHPFLQIQQRKSVLQKFKQYLTKALFPVDENFNPLKYLRQKLISSQKQKQIQSQYENKDFEKQHKFYSIKNMTYEDMKNQNTLHLLNNIHQRPIIFDPDNQAIKWLQHKVNLVSKDGLQPKIIITKSSFVGATKNVELAIKQGYLLILLIQDDLDEFTSQILNSKISQSLNRRLIQYNKNLFYMHQQFCLILINRNHHPNPSATYFLSHPIISFKITPSSLSNILLQQILKFQSQQQYKDKISLEIELGKGVYQKEQIENKVIQAIASLKNGLLSNQQIVQLINKGKDRKMVLQHLAQELTTKINHFHKHAQIYSNLSIKAIKIYKSLKVLNTLSQFYCWNVQIFIDYFKKALVSSIQAPYIIEADEQEDFTFNDCQIDQANYQFDNYIGHGNSRATSALSYVSAITSKILLQDRKQDFDEIDQKIIIRQSKKEKKVKFQDLIQHKQVFIQEQKKGTMSKQRESKIISHLLNRFKHTLSESSLKTWCLVLCLIQSPQCQIKQLFTPFSLRPSILDYTQKQLPKRLKQYLTLNQKDSIRISNQIVIHPNPFVKYTDQFKQIDILILSKLLKPDRFNQLINQLVRIKGYQALLEDQKLGVQDWFSNSDQLHPTLLIMGEDPLPKLTEFLGRKRYKNVILLAMGQGQSKIAQIVLEKQSKRQNIVIIHNLHISPQFYPYLSKTLQQLRNNAPHKNFRLILISSLSSPIPIQISSCCHKYLLSSPKSLQNQMNYLYQNLSHNIIKQEHKKVAYSMTLFHSVVNQLSKYKDGWIGQTIFSTEDFKHSIKVIKEILEDSLNLQHYQCNIDHDQLKSQIDHQFIDFKALKYLIGQVTYVGKLANQLDRQKMRILVNRFFNPQILQTNFKFAKDYQLPKKFTKQSIIQAIKLIPQNNPSFLGLHENIKPYLQQIESILKCLSECYMRKQVDKQQSRRSTIPSLPQINHKLNFINNQIRLFNTHLQSLQLLKGLKLAQIYPLLKQITSQTKIFQLKSFSNPHKFFIQIQKQAAIKFMLPFQNIGLLYSWIPRDNTTCYGIKNLRLQGATINKKDNNWYLDTGKQQSNITLYVYSVQIKKKNQNLQTTTKKSVRIPMYIDAQRQGPINSYGDNTNLLTFVTLDAQQNQEFWTLRSTAFIIN